MRFSRWTRRKTQ